MIFDKPSTRTRVSFESAAWTLGMLPIVLRPDELQLGRGETIADTARALSLYLDALTVRTFAQSSVEELAAAASIPVINALTNEHHPCQALADVMTLEEEFGTLAGIHGRLHRRRRQRLPLAHRGGGLAGFELRVATPPGLRAVAGRSSTRARRQGDRTGGRDRPDPRPGRGRRRAPTPSTPTSGPRWARRPRRGARRTAFAGFTVDATADGARPRRRRSSSTACPLIAARRSPTR